MGKWLKLREFFSVAQYKESEASLELTEQHHDMKIELFDTRDNIVAALHEHTVTITGSK